MSASEKLELEVAGRPIILVVDDVVLVRMLIADSLRARDFQVVEAASGEEAVRVLESDLEVAVVLTDIYMPAAELDGFALARWVHEHRPQIKVVVGSGVNSALDPADAHLVAGPIVPKPYDWNALEQRLRDAMRLAD